MLARLTAVPAPNWAKEVRGRLTPACLKAYTTRPEQSKPPGEAPP
jgi:hypothetical protein